MFDWAQQFADWLIYTTLHLSRGSKAGDALNFFVFDTLKIFLLLLFITFIMGIINSYFPIEKVRDALQKQKWYGLDYFMASFFGTVKHLISA